MNIIILLMEYNKGKTSKKEKILEGRIKFNDAKK
jgi:hypothetical protein